MAGPSLFRPSNIPSGLQGFWKLDEASGNRSDSSPNGNTLTDNNTVGSVAYDYWNPSGTNSADFERGNSEYLSIADGSQTGLELLSSYTVAFWIKAESLINGMTIIAKGAVGSSGWSIATNTNFDIISSNDTQSASQTTSPLSVGKWYHIVVVHDAVSNFRLHYINGNLDKVTSGMTTDASDNASDFRIGFSPSGGGTYFDGLLKDVAVWNTVLTPLQIKSLAMGVDLTNKAYRPSDVSTQPTSWWKLNEIGADGLNYNRADSSGSNTLTAVGQPRTRGGYVEATGMSLSGGTEYLEIVDGSQTGLDFTSTYSVSFWVYNSVGIGGAWVNKWSPSTGWNIQPKPDYGGTIQINHDGTAYNIQNCGFNTTGLWYHIAVVYDDTANTIKGYVDGVLKGTLAATTNPSNSTNPFRIARRGDGSDQATGRIADVAVWNGYTLTSDEVRRLASAFPIQQSGIVSYWPLNEARSAKTISVFGSAQIDTAQSKFGGASGLFNGSTDYLTAPDGMDWDFGTGDFTIDCWVRFNSITNSYFVHRSGNFRFGYDGTDGLYVNIGGNGYAAAWTPSTGVWYHVAVVRVGSQLFRFVDGTQVGTTGLNTDNILYSGTALNIARASTGTNYFNGWIDELRVSHTARWTTNFTPPSSAYTTDDRTALLLHMDGTDGSTTFTDSSASGSAPSTYSDEIGANDLQPTNSPVQAVGRYDACTDFESSSSQYLYITDGSQSGLDIDSLGGCWMCWFKPETATLASVLIEKGAYNSGWGLKIADGSAVLRVVTGAGEQDATTTLVAGNWYFGFGGYDGANRFVGTNAKIEGSGAGGGPSGTADAFHIGERTAGNNFDGLIDEALVSYRVFRDEEYKSVYVKGLVGEAVTSEPVQRVGYGQRGFFFLL